MAAGAGYKCVGSVRGSCGHSHQTIAAADKCIASDQRDCARAGGYSDRVVVPPGYKFHNGAIGHWEWDRVAQLQRFVEG